MNSNGPLLQLRGVSKRFGPVQALNDIDFCLRLMERGYRNMWTPYSTLIHHEKADCVPLTDERVGQVVEQIVAWYDAVEAVLIA